MKVVNGIYFFSKDREKPTLEDSNYIANPHQQDNRENKNDATIEH